MPHSDFQSRTFTYAVRVVRLVDSLPKDPMTGSLANQLLRSGTSVGANARSAARSRSRKEFIAKMGIVEEEADETAFWLELLVETGRTTPKKVGLLRKETDELISIAVASIKTARANATGPKR